MKYVKYNGKDVSKLSLGTVQFGINYGIANKDGQPTQSIVNDILDYVCSDGVNCFDTAQGYGNSEEVIGCYFHNIDEVNTSVVSKVDSKVLELDELDIVESIRTSLNKLDVKCLFGLLMHNSNLIDKWSVELSEKINLLKQKNMMKYFGVSIYSDEEFNLALDNKDINIIQIPFNLFDQRALQNKWFEKAKAKNKFIFIRSVYLQGLLLMEIENIPEKLNSAKKYVRIVDDFAKSLCVSKNELCLNFVSSIAKESSILFGCETLSQAKENLNIFNSMKDFDKKTIKKISDIFLDIDENIYNPVKW